MIGEEIQSVRNRIRLIVNDSEKLDEDDKENQEEVLTNIRLLLRGEKNRLIFFELIEKKKLLMISVLFQELCIRVRGADEIFLICKMEKECEK